MTIFIPRHFAGDDTAARELIAQFPFATLITPAAGELHVTHLPLLLEDTTLVGHVARANAHWRAFEQADTTAIFHGPHALVSRAWYAQPAQNVPTWNYAVTHVTGRARVVADPAGVRAAVESLTRRFEPSTLAPVDESRMGQLLEGIVAFRLPLARVEVKLKMSQNKSAAERAGVMRGLREAGDYESLATLAWMGAHEGP